MIFNKHIHEDDGHEYGVVEQFKDKDGTKNIVISFDGTGGSPGWAVQPKPAEVPLYEGKTGLSNICKMHLYAGGNVGNTTASCDGQVIISGIFFARIVFYFRFLIRQSCIFLEKIR